MKIKMLIAFQGRFDGQEFPLMEAKKEFSAPEDVPEKLADWLVSVRKATLLEGHRHYGGQEVAEFRNDDQLSKEVVETVDLLTVDKTEFTGGTEVDATPAAIKLAEKNNVNLADVPGTGSGGRVIMSDVEKFLEGEQ